MLSNNFIREKYVQTIAFIKNVFRQYIAFIKKVVKPDSAGPTIFQRAACNP